MTEREVDKEIIRQAMSLLGSRTSERKKISSRANGKRRKKRKIRRYNKRPRRIVLEAELRTTAEVAEVAEKKDLAPSEPLATVVFHEVI